MISRRSNLLDGSMPVGVNSGDDPWGAVGGATADFSDLTFDQVLQQQDDVIKGVCASLICKEKKSSRGTVSS